MPTVTIDQPDPNVTPRITQLASLMDVFFNYINANEGMPGAVAEGAAINHITTSGYATRPDAIRRWISTTIYDQRPLSSALLTQQAVSAGIAFNITFTPDAVDFPGLWMQLVYGVEIEIDFPQNVAKSMVDLTVQGKGQYGQTINQRVQTTQPLPQEGGTAKVRLWMFPGEAFMGTSQYSPWGFRPALTAVADPLGTAQTIVVAVAAGLPSGALVTANLLTRGHIEVDTLANIMARADQQALRAAFDQLVGA